MELKVQGKNSFRIRGKKAILFLGPLLDKVEADIIIADGGATPRGRLKAPKRGEPFLVPGAGEYEVAGVEIWGRKRGCWLIQMDDFRLSYLSPDRRRLGEKEIESLGRIDLLLLRIKPGRKGARDALEAMKKIAPPLTVLPAAEAGDFLDLADREDLTPQEKLVVRREDLSEEARIVLLKSQL